MNPNDADSPGVLPPSEGLQNAYSTPKPSPKTHTHIYTHAHTLYLFPATEDLQMLGPLDYQRELPK
jgi:hypothetical protein